MARWGMVIDLDRCVACQTCSVTCRAENNVPVAGPEDAKLGRAILWNDFLSSPEPSDPGLELGTSQHAQHAETLPGPLIPRACNHCDDTPCIKVCPVQATYRNEEGIVSQIYDRCIGCRYCTVACPYTARYFNWTAPNFEAPSNQQLSPDMSVRPVGVVEKCVFCIHRIRRSRLEANREGRPLRDGDVEPACVQSCPTGARFFGDLDDQESKVARLAESPRAFRLKEELGTKPKCIYLKEGE